MTQDDTTENMIFWFADLIAYVDDLHDAQARRHHRHRHAGEEGRKADPPVWLKPGDTIEIECPAIGVLRNSVADEA